MGGYPWSELILDIHHIDGGKYGRDESSYYVSHRHSVSVIDTLQILTQVLCTITKHYFYFTDDGL
jgi:hypothetical protein